MTTPDRASQTSAGVTTTYTYDGDGRRLAAQTGTTGAANTIARTAWDPATYSLIAEFDGSGTLQRDYTYGPGAISFSTTAASGSNYYLHPDLQGSTRAVTDSNGAITATASYEPYGVVKTHETLDPNAPASPIGWAGQYTDPDGQTNLRARLYNPTLGSFTVPDPASATSASATYTYADSNPMTESDPTGLDPFQQLISGTVSSVFDAVGAAGQAYQACFGGKGGCASAIVHAAVDTAIGAVHVLGTAAVIYGMSIATDGLADAVLVDGLEETVGAGIESEVASVAENGAANGSRTLFHYTDEAGLKGITESGRLNPSLRSVNPSDARYGNGQYLSDIAPGTKTPAQLSRTFLGQPFQGQRFTHYIELNVDGLEVVQGRPNVFVVPGETPLDIIGRIVEFGAN